jgi:RimJ/RimL family protein N-acetyltransferase
VRTDGDPTGVTMPGMFKRWWDRRVGWRAPEPGAEARDEGERGSVVRKGRLVMLRAHVPANREAFQRWYGDPEIAELLRHDLEPLTPAQSRAYFDTFILPSSARGLCFAIHERKSKRLVGTTALTDRARIKGGNGESALFRIVIGEKETWGQGYGTEATRLVAAEAFESLGLSEVRLEVFGYNQRAIAAYTRVGFEVTGEHVEWVLRRQTELRVIEMRLTRESFLDHSRQAPAPTRELSEKRRERQEARRDMRTRRRAERKAARVTARQGTAAEDELMRDDDVQERPSPD